MEPILTVRNLTLQDIPLICDYWLNSSPEYLESMGVDMQKLPGRKGWTDFLTEQVNLPNKQKASFCLVWEADGSPVGHSNINNISPGEDACMHLHIWNIEDRKKGWGLEFIMLSLSIFCREYNLKRILCEPYALNPAPNHLLKKAGFTFIEEVVKIPGSINFEQPVKRWEILC